MISASGNPLKQKASMTLSGTIIILLIVLAILAPVFFTVDPNQIAPRVRLQPPSPSFFMGTDMLGRDIWSRIAFGTRTSLLVGSAVALLAIAAGTFCGSLAGYFRAVDMILMRVLDGLMAIPGILLAIAFVSLAGPSLATVISALVITEIPRIARLVRASVLGIREEPFVEAAVGLGTRTPKILWQHILPNTLPLLIVQATYICASAILTEATLSFLGLGFPPDIPTWGNIMAGGREVFQRAPWIIFFPGALLALTVLAVNLLGDGLRDTLDPKLKIEH